MKAALCIACTDIVAPFRNWAVNPAWRWCQCGQVGTRWRDGDKGLLEVTAADGPERVRVLGFNNQVLFMAVSGLAPRSSEEWRTVHRVTCAEVGPNYLFHEAQRNCWALIVRPGESGDVFLIDYAEAKG